jgi:hypothetical protein
MAEIQHLSLMEEGNQMRKESTTSTNENGKCLCLIHIIRTESCGKPSAHDYYPDVGTQIR